MHKILSDTEDSNNTQGGESWPLLKSLKLQVPSLIEAPEPLAPITEVETDTQCDPTYDRSIEGTSNSVWNGDMNTHVPTISIRIEHYNCLPLL